ncbi:hypothetical protein ACLOJK_037450 [Asimina triloba]
MPSLAILLRRSEKDKLSRWIIFLDTPHWCGSGPRMRIFADTATNAGGSGAEHAITHVIIVVGTVGGVELVDSYAKDDTYLDPSAPESDSTDVVITDTIFSFISLAWLRDHVLLSILFLVSLLFSYC